MLNKETIAPYSLSTSLQNIADVIYPIGSYYWSSESTNPSDLFGGTWEQITDRFLYAVGTKAVNITGGEESHTLTIDESPTHTHTRGTMEITGTHGGHAYKSGNPETAPTGAFVGTGTYSGGAGKDGNVGVYRTDFQASNSWTGETSASGGGQAHNNMPPYLTAYCWHRTA